MVENIDLMSGAGDKEVKDLKTEVEIIREALDVVWENKELIMKKIDKYHAIGLDPGERDQLILKREMSELQKVMVEERQLLTKWFNAMD